MRKDYVKVSVRILALQESDIVRTSGGGDVETAWGANWDSLLESKMFD